MKAKNVFVVTVNWKNGPDTVEALQSICDVNSPCVGGVVVCDNASNDGSSELIRSWAAAADVGLLEYTWRAGGFVLSESATSNFRDGSGLEVVLIHTGANLGFSGGNNVGIEFIRRNRAYEQIFLLNNDALLKRGAVESMAETFIDPKVGMCGATVVYHHTPDRIQALGGSRFSPLFGRASHIGAGRLVSDARHRGEVEKNLDYILGAALMISRHCLDAIGLLEERYFLYYEEIDWATRARRAGFTLAYAPDAVIFHKEGGTIGSSTDRTKRSLLSEYYLLRSRLSFTRKLYPVYLPTVLLFSGFQVIRHLARGEFGRFKNGCRALLGRRFLPS